MRIKKTGACEKGSKKKGIGNILLAGLFIVAAMNTRPLEVKAATAYMIRRVTIHLQKRSLLPEIRCRLQTQFPATQRVTSM